MANKSKKQENETFEVMAQGQWNKNRERFEFLHNGVCELADLFGLELNAGNGTAIAYHPENAKIHFPSIPEQKIQDVKQPAIDTDAISTAIISSIESKLQEHFKTNPIKPPKVTASVDESVHIANNNALLERFNNSWNATFIKMLNNCRIIREICNDSSIIYKVDKEGKMTRLVDEKEKVKQDFEKKPKFVKLVITHVNTVKKAILFYIMGMVIIFMAIWNICLQQENRDLELTKKEYMILRWHVNTKPESKAFMEELDSFVKAEGISPVYDRVVEDIKTSKEQQTQNSNKK